MRRVLAALALAFAPCALRAQVPPDAEWRTVESEHFRVTFPPGLEALAVRAADRAETAHARLSAGLASAPAGKIDILLTDYVDLSNGMATPFPSNRIVVYARPPVDRSSLSYFGDWIELVVTHELAHVFHLDATGGLGRVLRGVFGRVPSTWPLFPAVGTPRWSTEGLATYIESMYTGEGRVHGSYHDMVLRTAALEGAFESIDQVTGSGPRWPGGLRAYIYGSMFSEYLSELYGPEVHRELVERTARAWIPPVLAFDRVARKAMGASFTDAFRAWREAVEASAARLADSLRVAGVTGTERLTAAGYEADHPRVARDGRVAYAAYDGRSTPATRILDPAGGGVRDLARRNGLDVADWLPDGSLLTAQLEYEGPYRIHGDLYRVDPAGRERRLTTGARLSGVDASPDGRRAVAVQAVDGTNRLVVVELETGGVRALTTASPGVHWALPRWSPAGDRIAAGRWRRGMYDVVVLDTLGRVLRELTRDRAVDAAPAWSPDGRYVVFSSDRSGIPNLYAYDLDADGSGGGLRQVTNLLTGAFSPDVSPDGRWIYFSGYHADGFHIERIRFDPAGWRDPGPIHPRFRVAEVAAPPGGAAHAAADSAGRTARRYAAWPTLRPRFWLPALYDEGGLFAGLSISGRDLVGRHAYAASAAYNFDKGLYAGAFSYGYAGLGNPVLSLDLWRSWERVGLVPPAEAPRASLMSREHGVALAATLRRRRWRSDAYLTLGAERVEESLRLFDAPGFTLGYTGTTRDGLFTRAGYADYQRHPFSISRESGVSLAVSARRRWDRRPVRFADGTAVDGTYEELAAVGAAYPAFRAFGFANHVLALRLAGRVRTGPGADPFYIGGAASAGAGILGASVGGEDRFLPVRGFDDDARFGTRAWAASLEYRLPVALIDRGHRLWPVYLDRLSAALFLDAGHAWCADAERDRFAGCPAPGQAPLVGAGAELGLDVSLFFGPPVRLRAGIGAPLGGGRAGDRPVAYLRLGPGF